MWMWGRGVSERVLEILWSERSHTRDQKTLFGEIIRQNNNKKLFFIIFLFDWEFYVLGTRAR